MNHCFKIIFNSNWSKRRFLEGMHNDYVNSEKLVVINQSAQRNKVNLNNKKNIITFVGKLNKSKGYDLFGQSIIKILNKYKNWTGIVIGDEPRDKLEFNHKNLIKLGFLKHKDVLNIYKKSSIAVVCSRWEEPFGRTSLEASSNGCAVIISNRGGLPETITNGVILKQLNVKNVTKEIENLIQIKNKEFEEPSITVLPDGKLFMLLRENKSKILHSIFSENNGATWSKPKKTSLIGYPADLIVLNKNLYTGLLKE